jgi:uncharacterized protein YdaU (DUF1376 family)
MSKPWMPLYVGDYLKKTTHLGALESGAYLHLIMDYWSNGKLPTDERQLARIAKVTDREWSRIRDTIAAFFEDGWRHQRIEEEIANAEKVASSNAEKARGAANKRWSKHPPSNAPSIPQAMLQNAQSQSQSQSESKKEKKEAVADATRPKATRLPDDWTPTPDERRFAWGRGLSAAEIDTEAIKFRNYWTAKSGKDATKLDWSRTWQNWILNRRGTPNGQAKPNLVDAAKKLANTFADRPGNGLEEGGNLVRLLPQSGRG